jgi:hypothetical protein
MRIGILSRKIGLGITALLIGGMMTGCATTQPYDYSAFRQSKPQSILVLPPVNDSLDVNAPNSVLAQVTLPLAESGYYVFPVTVVERTFRENGLTSPSDIHAVAPAKLLEIFGADAGLYLNIKKYGTTYAVISSSTTVAADAKLVDLRTGQLLWEGSALAQSDEGGSSGGGLVGLMVKAVVNQVIASVSDKGHTVAGVATQRLLTAGQPNGMLYGQRSPYYQKN